RKLQELGDGPGVGAGGCQPACEPHVENPTHSPASMGSSVRCPHCTNRRSPRQLERRGTPVDRTGSGRYDGGTQRWEGCGVVVGIRVGTCAWSDHENFSPRGLKAGDRLAYYAQHFNLVEVDATYYHLQPRRNFEKWARVTPPDFVFNVKAHRSMTLHDRPRPPEATLVETFALFREAVQPLQEAGKLRALHFQFPPWFTRSRESLDYLRWIRELLPEATIAIEFRHRSWF